jgi:hypothetical protein
MHGSEGNNSQMPKLIFTSEHFAGRVYELVLEKTTVGRGDHNTLALHDPSVSQVHCEILVHGPEVIVRDLGSANGTFVNDLRLDRQQCQVKSGQTVRFGSVEARLDLGLPVWDDTASEETAVFAMRRSQRDQRRAEKNPAPVSAAAKFESGAESDPATADHTVLLPRTSIDQNATPQVPLNPEVPRRRLSTKTLILTVLLLALGLAFSLWLTWGRK